MSSDNQLGLVVGKIRTPDGTLWRLIDLQIIGSVTAIKTDGGIVNGPTVEAFFISGGDAFDGPRVITLRRG